MAQPIHQQASHALTSLDAAQALLAARLRPVDPIAMPLDAALGCVCAEPVIAPLHPPRAYALRAGWALRSDEIIGASNYAPVAPLSPPVAVDASDELPAGYDCVVEAHGVEMVGPMAQVMVEAAPGAHVRRPGEDAQAGQVLIAPGQALRAHDLACLATLRMTQVRVRQPHIAIVAEGASIAGDFLARALAGEGARVSLHDRQDLVPTLTGVEADLILLLGRAEEAIEALRLCGEVIAHGLALEPGGAAAIGEVRGRIVIAVPTLLDQTFSLWLGLLRPMLDHMTARQPRKPGRFPLTRKIASRVGVAEVALLRREGEGLAPLAVGDLPLQCLCAATHAMVIPAGHEGHGAGDHVDAYALVGADRGP